jgi:hypothetical protein
MVIAEEVVVDDVTEVIEGVPSWVDATAALDETLEVFET